MIRPLRKVIFPVGGMGTRFLPATKSMPKEMLPVVDKPLIHYAFEEAQEAGVELFVFVTGRNKSAINNHFDHSYELQRMLSEKNKEEELELARDWLPPAGHIFFTRQQEPLGLGHAVLCARHMIGDEPFAVILADDMVLSKKGCLAQMVEAYAQVGGNVLAVMEVPREQTSHYGVVDIAPGTPGDARLVKAKALVEKPKPENAPSNLCIIGRYILQPEVFDLLASQKPGAGGEIQLTDAINRMIGKSDVHGFTFDGERFDCGSRVGYVAANVAYALEREEMKGRLGPMLKGIVERHGGQQ